MNTKFSLKNLDIIDALYERFSFFKSINNQELLYKAHAKYIYHLITLYYQTKNEIEDSSVTLKKLKQLFNRSFLLLIKNYFYNWKEKTLLLLFLISPYLYGKYNSKNM